MLVHGIKIERLIGCDLGKEMGLLYSELVQRLHKEVWYNDLKDTA